MSQSDNEKTPTRPDGNEIATTRDGRDITRGYVDNLPILPPSDHVLQARSMGDLRIYDEVLRDDQVSATFAQRRLAVVSRDWEVLPGGESARDKQAAQMISDTLDDIRFDAVTDRMLYGLFYGFAVGECLWRRQGTQVVLDAIKVRDRRRFGFRPSGELVLKTTRNPDGEPLPDGKFWCFSTGASHDDEPYGVGLAHWLYWPVLFKRNNIKFWLMFLEKFGMPTALGKFPSGATSTERDRLLEATQAIQSDSGVIIPEGMVVELLEAARSGSADYVTLVDTMNAAISKVVLGQTMTTDSGSSRSQAEVHMDVRQDLIKADADLICASANRSWVRWLIDWNLPGAAYPKIWRRIDNEPDLKVQAERDKILHEIGYRPNPKYILDTYGDGFDPAQPVPPAPGPAPSFAQDDPASDPADELDALTDQLEQKAAQPIESMLNSVRELMNQVQTLEELQSRLVEIYPQLQGKALANVMGQALSVAALAGRFDILEQTQ